MREIKFRGKAECSIERLNEIGIKHDNGWVYGHLVMYGETPYIVGDFVEVDEEYTFNEFWVKVYSESVGQYTGLKDKNNIEIYEGDIVDFAGYYKGCGDGITIVKFHEGSFMFESGGAFHYFQSSGDYNLLGNIHDNPELLEVV